MTKAPKLYISIIDGELKATVIPRGKRKGKKKRKRTRTNDNRTILKVCISDSITSRRDGRNASEQWKERSIYIRNKQA